MENASQVAPGSTKFPPIRNKVVPSTPLAEIPVIQLPADGLPVTLDVSYNGDKVLFGLDGDTAPALAWKAGGYALIINFVFLEDEVAPEKWRIEEMVAVTPGVWFSAVSPSPTPINQTLCIPPIPGTYHIGAEVTRLVNDDRVLETDIKDPVIVVTPIVG